MFSVTSVAPGSSDVTVELFVVVCYNYMIFKYISQYLYVLNESYSADISYIFFTFRVKFKVIYKNSTWWHTVGTLYLRGK